MLATTDVKFQTAVEKTFTAFFTPPRYDLKARDLEILARGNNYRLPYEDGELAVTSWGDSNRPAVLLMHGWGGARAQMTGFVEPLVSAGFRVVAYDQPAHGDSDGTQTTILQIAPTMELARQKEGEFDAIIAHSFGTLVTSYAIAKRGFPPPFRLIYLGAYNRAFDALPRFQAIAKLPDAVMNGFRTLIHERMGSDSSDEVEIANEGLAPQIAVPALLFHDAADDITPIEDSRAIARNWKTAQLIETNGLGHRGALQSAQIHRQIVRFITIMFMCANVGLGVLSVFPSQFSRWQSSSPFLA